MVPLVFCGVRHLEISNGVRQIMVAVWRLDSGYRDGRVIAFALLAASVCAPTFAFAGQARAPAQSFEDLLSKPARAQAHAPLPSALVSGSTENDDPLFPYAGRSGAKDNKPSSAYRTVCVRLCDGYYWPISNTTDMAHFQRDRTSCESNCEQPAKLYFQPSGDTDTSQLLSLDGKPYDALAQAYSYRTTLNPSCRCRPEPWSDSEVERHRQYERDVQTRPPLPLMSSSAAAAEQDPSPAASQSGNQAALATSGEAVDSAVAAFAEPLPDGSAPILP